MNSPGSLPVVTGMCWHSTLTGAMLTGFLLVLLVSCSGPTWRHLFYLMKVAAVPGQPFILVGPIGPSLMWADLSLWFLPCLEDFDAIRAP